MLGGGIVDCSVSAAAGAANAIGKVEPGFGNDEKTCPVGKLCRPLAQIEAGSRPAPVLGFSTHRCTSMRAHRNSALEFAYVERHIPVPNKTSRGLLLRAKISQRSRIFRNPCSEPVWS